MKVFPTRNFCFQGHDADIESRSVSGGVSLSNEEDLIVTDGGGRVVVQFSEADLDEPEIANDWRALSTILDAGAAPIIVPLGDARHQMFGDVWTPPGGSPWWTEDDFAEVLPHAALTSAYSLRATQITVSVANLAAPVRAGIWLSIDHENWRHRAYRIGEVTFNDGLTAAFTIRPPLREATADDTPVEFYDPKCTMRLDGRMSSATMLGYAEPGSVRFVEYPGATDA